MDLKRFLLSALSLCLLTWAIPSELSAQDLPPEPEAEGPSTVEAPIETPAETASIPEHSVVEGPLQEQRQQLYNQIQAAKASGIGIKNYMMAFDYVEGMAKRNESEDAIKKRMVPIISALANQLKTKEYLKTKPPISAGSDQPLLAPGQNLPENLRMFGGLGGNQTQDLIRRVLEKQGTGGGLPAGLPDGLPKDLQNGIPAGIDPNMIKEKLKDPRVRELLKKYQGGN